MSYISWYAINADNVPRARDFYSKVFGWTFEPWGPPNFYRFQTGEPVTVRMGGLQERRELVPGGRMMGSSAPLPWMTLTNRLAPSKATAARW